MKYLDFAIILLLSLLLSGCVSTVNTVERANPHADPQVVQDYRIITDRSLDNNLDIIEVKEALVSGNILKIQANIANRSQSPKTFAYKFEWIGSDGMDRRSPGGTWRLVKLQGGEQKAISGVANSPDVVDFRLKFQKR